MCSRERPRLLVIASDGRRNSVEIGEQTPFVDADQIELIAQPANLTGGNHIFGQCSSKTVRDEERVERPGLVGAEREGGRLGHDTLIERRRLQKTGKISSGAATHERPRCEVPFLSEQLVEIP